MLRNKQRKIYNRFNVTGPLLLQSPRRHLGVRNVRIEQYIEYHMQFHAVLTYQFKVAKKRVGPTKAARARVTQALSEDSEESDVDEDEDEDDMAI